MTENDRQAMEQVASHYQTQPERGAARESFCGGNAHGRATGLAKIVNMIDDGIAVEPEGEGAKALRQLLAAMGVAENRERPPTRSDLDDAFKKAKDPDAKWEDGINDEEVATRPMQKVVRVDGVIRFRKNAIVRMLVDEGSITLNQVADRDFSQEDMEQFIQLIGFSVCGAVPYMSEAMTARADLEADGIESKEHD